MMQQQQAGQTPQWQNGEQDQPRSSRTSTFPIDHSAGGNAHMSVGEQLMQVDQAITLTLQEIDANFAKTHQLITSRILPAVKRYGIASHNTWQGAKFWHRFFETASDINLAPTRGGEGQSGDGSAEETAGLSFEHGGEGFHSSAKKQQRREPHRLLDESGELHEDDFEPPRMSDASVAAFKRLGQPQRPAAAAATHQRSDDATLDEAMDKLGVYDRPPLASGSSPKRTQSKAAVHATPRSGKKISNPFQRNTASTSVPGAESWNGIADLRKTPLAGNAKTKVRKGKPGPATEEDEDSLAWPAGMSPPVTMQFSVPRSRYDKTPAKEAARLVVDDLLRTVEGSTPAARRAMMQEREAAMAAATGSRTTPSKGLAVGPKGQDRGVNRPTKGRQSMPTPPTITKRVGANSTRTVSQQQRESTPKTAATSSSRLMDEDEEGQSTFDTGRDGVGGDEGQPAHAAPFDQDDDEDSDNDVDDDSDEDEDGVDAGTLPTLTRPRGVLVRENAAGGGKQAGLTASSISHSIDEDTLFGIRDPSLISASKRAGVSLPAAPSSAYGKAGGAATTSTHVKSSGASASSRAGTVTATPSGPAFQPMGQVQAMGTVYRGRPLLGDERGRDETFSVPSPTPAGQRRE